MSRPGDIYALVWGSRLLQRRGAGSFAIFPGDCLENNKLVFRLTTPLDDEDGQLMLLAGWQRQIEEEIVGEYWSLNGGEPESGNHLPLRAHVMREEEHDREDFGPQAPIFKKETDDDDA